MTEGLNLLPQVIQLAASGRLKEALILAKQAEMLTRQPGGSELDLAQCLVELGRIHRLVGDYPAAETAYQEALSLFKNNEANDPLAVAHCQNNLAVVVHAKGRFAAAIALYEQALPTMKRGLGDKHPDVARAMTNLAQCYRNGGQISESERLHRDALAIKREVLKPGDPSLAISLNGLADIYQQLGQYDTAEPLARESLEITRKTLGEKHPSFATSLQNLAVLLGAKGLHEQAIPLLRQALSIFQSPESPNPHAAAMCQHNLANCENERGNLSAAARHHQESHDQFRETLGENHPQFADALNDQAALSYRRGDFAAAEPKVRKALEIRRRALGDRHPDVGMNLNNLGVVLTGMGRYEEALALMDQACEVDDHLLGQVFSIGSETQRTQFLRRVKKNLDSFLTLIVERFITSPRAIRRAADMVLRRKAAGAEGLAAQRDAILSGRYPHRINQLEEYHGLRRRISTKSLAGPGEGGVNEHLALLSSWESERDQREAELARQIPEMNLEHRLRQVDADVIAAALPAGSVLVELFRFDVFAFEAAIDLGDARWKPARYLALLVFGSEPERLRLVDLGDSRLIDGLVARWRQEIVAEGEQALGRDMTRPQQAPVRREVGGAAPMGARLHDVVIKPLVDWCQGRSRFFFAPDGDLARLPFESLPNGKGGYLLDEWGISYLNCGRDLLRLGTTSSSSTSPLVVADPDFDLGRSSVPDSSSDRKDDRRSGVRLSRDFEPGQFHFPRLPGTRFEGKLAAGKLGVSQLWLQGSALKARFRKECRSPRILHLSTHGFFLQDEMVQHVPGASEEPFGRLAGPLPENPLLRSGLALAGANTWLAGGTPPADAEDGLLTAEEVSGLDLLGTDLVVLSACETGLGEVQTGEGVFGLCRAFVLAGAKTLVMSLWKVHDLATAVLMERFYDNLLVRRLPRDEALRQAQIWTRDVTLKEIRPRWLSRRMIDLLVDGHAEARDYLQRLANLPDTQKPFALPYFWGAFICQGNPNPLPSESALSS